MCPSLKNEICDVAGIEPERIQCADKRTCQLGEWEKCPVLIAQFFVSVGTAFAKVA
jgi:hypothetical protein